jgi:hypothetical protein
MAGRFPYETTHRFAEMETCPALACVDKHRVMWPIKPPDCGIWHGSTFQI